MKKLLLVLLLASLPGAAQFGNNAKKLQGRAVAPTAPSNTNTLCWDSSAATWKPCTAGAGSGGVTAASNIGKGQLTVGSDGAKAIEPSTADIGVVKLTKGVPGAAASTDLSDTAGLVRGAASLTTNNKLLEVSTTDGTIQEVSNQTANTVYAGPATGAAAAPGFRAQVVADVPAAVGYWTKYTVAYSNAAFLAAATAVSVTLVALPANVAVEGIRIKHSTAFAGTAVSSATVSLGDGTTHTGYANAFDVFAAVANTTQYWDGGAYSMTAAGHNLVARFTANTNFGDGGATVLTAGSVDIWVKTAVLP
jgi:hypothetical protein